MSVGLLGIHQYTKYFIMGLRLGCGKIQIAVAFLVLFASLHLVVIFEGLNFLTSSRDFFIEFMSVGHLEMHPYTKYIIMRLHLRLGCGKIQIAVAFFLVPSSF